jgi:type IV secretion system protein VirB2
MAIVPHRTHDCADGQVGLAMLVLLVAIAIPEVSWAAVDSVSWVICGIIDMILGTFGRALATLAIIFLGVGAMLGKVSWGLALTVVVGIAVVFNSEGLVTALVGGVGCSGA